MTLEDSSGCTQEQFLGYAPASYFLMGLIEIAMSFFIALVVFKRNCFPSLSKSKVVTYVLPVYISVVIPLNIICFLVGVQSALGLYTTSKILLTIKWTVIRWLTESLSIFLMHPGIGVYSARNSIFRGMLWSFLHGFLVLLSFYLGGFNVMLKIIILILIELLICYLGLALIPLTRLHRRPALIRYAALSSFVLLYQFLVVVTYILSPRGEDAACAVEISFSICEFMQICVIYLAFVEDSQFWQGLYSNAEVNLNEPLLGIWDMNQANANLVANSVIQLERKVVNIIPFSQLRVDTSMFFSGGTARVYKGTYLQHQVAIKFLFCIELTPERIFDFCHEATILNSLKHRNIVTCHGVAIMPPAISLVTEFCAWGSLFDFLHSTDLSVSPNHNRPRLGTNESNSQSQHHNGSCSIKLSTSEHDGVGDRRHLASRLRVINSLFAHLLQRNSSTDKMSNNDSITPQFLGNSTNTGGESKSSVESTSLDLEYGLDSNSGRINSNNHQQLRQMQHLAMQHISVDKQINQSVSYDLSRYLDPSNTGLVDKEDVAAKLAEAMTYSSNRTNQLDPSNDREYVAEEQLFPQQSMSKLLISRRFNFDNSAAATRHGSMDNVLSPIIEAGGNNGSNNSSVFQSPPTKTLATRSGSIRLKSTTAVMLTAEMGFGLGPNKKNNGRNRSSSQAASTAPNASPALSRSKHFRDLSYGLSSGGGKDSNSLSNSRSLSKKQSQLSRSLLFVSSGGVHNSEHSLGHLLPLSVRLSMIRDCAAGLAYIHSKGFMHCDIKSLNFLVTSDLTVKLADLGEARVVAGNNQDENGQQRAFPGNINWSSPETLGNLTTTQFINQSADVWSLAMVMVEILSGEVPFDTDDCRSLTFESFIDRLRDGMRPVIPQGVTHVRWLVELIQQAWVFDPELRTTAQSIVATIEAQLAH